MQFLLKAPSKLDKIKIRDEENPYFQIINRMISAITAEILGLN